MMRALEPRQRASRTGRHAIAAAAWIVAALAAPSTAHGFGGASVGGHEGEIDVNVHFIGEFGTVEPSERPTTWQAANVKTLQLGAGYAVGKVGPFQDFYVRLEGGYYLAAAEAVENPDDDLPVGYEFFDQDKGGFITAIVSANLVHEDRLTFGLFAQGTFPIAVNLQKFSNVHLHYAGGGSTLGVFLTDPTKLVRLGTSTRLFLGSGAFDGEFQHNAAITLTNLYALEVQRWLLPWRAGVAIGPHFEGDLNEHVNTVYNSAYAGVTPDFVNGDRVRALRFAVAIWPYIRITDHAAIELGYVQSLFGYDLGTTQLWTGGVRAQF